MTNAALRGKPDAGNPHVRFDEGEVVSATTPRRGSLLYRITKRVAFLALLGMADGAGADAIPWIDFGSETNRTAAQEIPISVAGFDSVTRTSADYAVGLDMRRFATAAQDGDLDTREPNGFMIIFR